MCLMCIIMCGVCVCLCVLIHNMYTNVCVCVCVHACLCVCIQHMAAFQTSKTKQPNIPLVCFAVTIARPSLATLRKKQPVKNSYR